ncbi:MAG: hypothetical protein RL612_334, partial [Actinomycetota bacterium]
RMSAHAPELRGGDAVLVGPVLIVGPTGLEPMTSTV